MSFLTQSKSHRLQFSPPKSSAQKLRETWSSSTSSIIFSLRLKALYLLFFFFFLILTSCLASPSGTTGGQNGSRTPIINTRYGQVQGTYRILENGDKVATYLGIPYATPPINKNRLNPTRASPLWKRVLQAVSFGPSCPQNPPKKFAHLLRDQSEDCLYLNLYVPGKINLK